MSVLAQAKERHSRTLGPEPRCNGLFGSTRRLSCALYTIFQHHFCGFSPKDCIPFILFFSSNTKAEIYKSFTNFKKNISLFLTMELFSFIGLLTITFILPHIPSTAKVSISSSTPIFVLIFGLLLKTYKKADYIENISKPELRKKLFLFLLISYGTFLVIKP